MRSETTTVRTMTVPIGGGRVLRIALTHNAAGEPEDLCIGAGYMDETPLRVLAKGVNVPAAALPGLRDALAALDGTP